MTTNTNKELIQSAYSTALHPDQLSIFEDHWARFLARQTSAEDGEATKQEIQEHLIMALRVVERLTVETDKQQSAQDIADRHVGACAIIDETGQIVAINDDAVNVFGDARSITNANFHASDVEDLLSWLTQFAWEESEQYQFHYLQIKGEREPKIYFISPIKISENTDKGNFVMACVELGASKTAYGIIKDTFGLTDTETEVALLISNGFSPKNIAEKRDTSLHTVRTQIKQILAKTSTHSMHDLTRLLIGLSFKYKEVSTHTAHHAGSAAPLKYTRKSGIILNDGRYMDVTEQGTPDGKPILRFHSFLSGVQLTETSASEVYRKNYRIIAPSRAGFGKSDKLPKMALEDRINQSVEDYCRVLDHLKIDKVILMSSRASCFSQRFALKYPDRSVGIVMIGSVPLWKDEHLDSLKPRHKGMVKTSMTAPYAVPYVASIGKMLIDMGQTRLFIKKIDEKDHIDKAAMEKRENFEAISRMYKHVSQQGIQSFVEELPSIHTDWSEDAKKLTCPIRIILGSELEDQPRSALEDYKKIAPHAEHSVIPNAGSYILTTHAADVFSAFDEIAYDADAAPSKNLTP